MQCAADVAGLLEALQALPLGPSQLARCLHHLRALHESMADAASATPKVGLCRSASCQCQL